MLMTKIKLALYRCFSYVAANTAEFVIRYRNEESTVEKRERGGRKEEGRAGGREGRRGWSEEGREGRGCEGGRK